MIPVIRKGRPIRPRKEQAGVSETVQILLPIPADEPYSSAVPGGMELAPGDIVLLRAGSYNEQLLIREEVTLRASRGDAIIGR